MIKALEFFSGKRVFITGSTGFKGSWLAYALALAGAEVTGYALEPHTTPNLFSILDLSRRIDQVIGDVRDLDRLIQAVKQARPDIVLHLAGQPILKKGYQEPVETFAINGMGTVHMLQAVRKCPEVRAVVMITTDKVYQNENWVWPYRETDTLGGQDPYSASKVCSEIAIESFRASYFPPDRYDIDHQVLIASTRAGNVIGGGDWSAHRLIPDIIRSVLVDKRELVLRNVQATRPWEHVLEPLSGYLCLAKGLYKGDRALASAWNFAPPVHHCLNVEQIVRSGLSYLNSSVGYRVEPEKQKEDQRLELDASKAWNILGWRAALGLQETLEWTFDWYAKYYAGDAIVDFTTQQLHRYFEIQQSPMLRVPEELYATS